VKIKHHTSKGTVRDYTKNHYFQSFGLCDIETQLHSDDVDIHHFYKYPNVLIDIANGHMSKLIPLIKEIKEKFPNIVLMVGNVANPETFANLGLAGADYVRCSIGTGAGCTTAANVSINYPMGSLIEECRQQKVQLGLKTKIVADGGMRNYSDIIKALALGADYVMIGSTFNKAIESAGFNYLYGVKISQMAAETLWRWGFPVKKKYRGMSTKAVQRSWGKTNLVTAEGITKYQKVEYTLEQWIENFKDYLKSAMSYTNAKKLDDFIGVAQYVFITDAARRRFDK
jgi:NAD(P)H-dependent flavin oxidoreductase YrpB (nitropropane dioxygenase family)